MQYIVLQYGVPNSVVTDQGTQFMGDVFRRLCKLLKILKLITSVYHPESNGALEKTHKTMVEYLLCYCSPRGRLAQVVAICVLFITQPHIQ